MNKIYLSQKQAKLTLRAAGFSVEAADNEVAEMAKTTFGKREKVKVADIEKILNHAAQPTPPKPLSIRPVIPRHMRNKI